MIKSLRAGLKVALAGGVLCSAFAIAAPAQAFTECTVNVLDVYSGDGGYLWIHYTNGGSSYVVPGAAIQQTVAAIGMTALVANRQIRVRYSTDGVVCTTSSRSDLIGVYLT